MATSQRVDRVRELLLRELGAIISRLKDPRIGMLTVVDTEVSRDLRYVTMYVSFLGDEEQRRESLAGLDSALGFVRREVAKRVRLRYVPELRVRYDPTAERAARISALIDHAIDGEDA